MINAINLLKMEAQGRRSMTTPNANTITEYAAAENARLADEYDLAAEALRRMHNKAFEDGIVDGVKAIVESCNRRRELKAPNALAQADAACGVSPGAMGSAAHYGGRNETD